MGLDGVDAAVAAGELSPAQAAAVADGAVAAPEAEAELLAAAASERLPDLREQARRAKAAADADPEATQRRIHRRRFLRRWNDAEGGYNAALRCRAADGAAIDAALAPLIDQLFNLARREGRRESPEAYAADALVGLCRYTTGAAQPPPASTASAAAHGADSAPSADPASGEPSSGEPAPSAGTGGGTAGCGSRFDDLVPASDSTMAECGTPVDDPSPASDSTMAECSTPVDDPGPASDSIVAGNQVAAGDGAGQVDLLAAGEGAAGRVDGAQAGSAGSAFSGQAARPVAPQAEGARPPDRGGGVDWELRRTRRRESKVIVVVSAEALRRGRVAGGEVCEIAGVGPVPVAAARELLGEAFLALVVTDGVDVRTVVHAGRQVTARQRTALEARGYQCEVPNCHRRHLLEIDHVTGWALTKTTRLEDLAWLCDWHHAQKTREGYRLTGPPGERCWLHPDGRAAAAPPARPPPAEPTPDGRQRQLTLAGA